MYHVEFETGTILLEGPQLLFLSGQKSNSKCLVCQSLRAECSSVEDAAITGNQDCMHTNRHVLMWRELRQDLPSCQQAVLGSHMISTMDITWPTSLTILWHFLHHVLCHYVHTVVWHFEHYAL